MKATEDFLELVIFAHIIVAAKNVKANVTATHTCTDLAKKLVNKFILISVPAFDAIGKRKDDTSDDLDPYKTNDSVFLYAVDILSMGLFLVRFQRCSKGGGRRQNCFILEILAGETLLFQ